MAQNLTLFWSEQLDYAKNRPVFVGMVHQRWRTVSVWMSGEKKVDLMTK